MAEIKLTTKDLMIRETTLEDIDTFEVWERLPEVTEFFSIEDGQTREAAIRKYVLDKENTATLQFSILLKETGELIGRIVIGDIEPEWK